MSSKGAHATEAMQPKICFTWKLLLLLWTKLKKQSSGPMTFKLSIEQHRWCRNAAQRTPGIIKQKD